MKSLFLLIFFLLSCAPGKPTSLTIATLNGEPVTLEAFQEYLALEQWKFGEASEEVKGKILDAFLKDHLLLAEAKKRGVGVSQVELAEDIKQFKSHYPKSEDFEKLLSDKGWSAQDFAESRAKELTIQKLAEAVTNERSSLTEADLQRYYQDHQLEFRHAEQVHARQIVTDSREKALALKDLLVKGAPFEEVAMQYSLSPDRKKGGDLGWFERGVMPRDFDRVCFDLPIGELSPIVKTPYGHHLFQVLDKRPAGVYSYAEVKEGLKKRIVAEQGRSIFQEWYENLQTHADIQMEIDVWEKIP